MNQIPSPSRKRLVPLSQILSQLEEESKRILHLFCEESVFLLRKRRPLDREPVHLLADVAD